MITARDSAVRMRPAARLAAYRELGRVQFRTTLTYRFDFAFSVLILLLQIFLLRVVWTSVYADQASFEGSGGVGAIDLQTQIAYATLATLQFWLFVSPFANQLAQRVYQGRIATDLVRPVGILQQAIFSQVGITAALAPFALLALPFAIVVGGARMPPTVDALVGYVLSTVCAYAVTVLLSTLVGMMAFWTVEITGPSMIYRLVAQVLSGALVPLWFMPDWLRSIAGLLPFQSTTYTPVAIYLGKISGPDVVQAIGFQAFWVVALWLVLRLVWSRALRRVVVMGG